MRNFFRKNQILTIPNLLSVFRIALIPIIVWLYKYESNYSAAISVILLSGATDIVDGWLARSFNMVSDFGKALDPLADKLTQAALLLCLLCRYKSLLVLTAIFGVFEISKFICGFIVAKRCDQVNSAKWYGKLNTVVIYITMILLILFPNISKVLAGVLMLACGSVMIVSGVLYIRFYGKLLNKYKTERHEVTQ